VRVKVLASKRLHRHFGRAMPAEFARFASLKALAPFTVISEKHGVKILKNGLKAHRYGV
jgi:hypothetical protein